MAQNKQKPIDAVDVLNWEYLVENAEFIEGKADSVEAAIGGFAYDFTSTADEEKRNEMLRQILHNGTCVGSLQAAEDFVQNTAGLLHCDAKLLRQFAKERGIRLKRG